MAKVSKKITPSEAKQKIARFCAYQERSHREVRDKLYEYGLSSADVDELLTQLITEGYLNEERFAKAFAGGKFRLKRWGRVKIVHELESRGLTSNCISSGLSEIDDASYHQALVALLERKEKEVVASNAFEKRDKLARYAIQKGYEPELVWEILKRKKQ